MKTEQYVVIIPYKGKQQTIPVVIKTEEEDISIYAETDGFKVHFVPDMHNGLRCAGTEFSLDEELLCQVGKAIREQRP